MCRETHEQWAVVDLERLVVSMPSRELLVQQPEDYQQSAIPSDYHDRGFDRASVRLLMEALCGYKGTGHRNELIRGLGFAQGIGTKNLICS